MIMKIELDNGSGPATITYPGMEAFSVSRHDLGRWLQHLPDSMQTLVNWLDMLPSLGIAFTVQANGVIRMLISRPPEEIIAHVGVHGGEYEDLPITFPARLWNTLWRNDKLVESNLWVAERTVRSLRDTARLTPFPYGNVEQPHGRVCWGSASLNHLSISNPLELETIFFRSGLNNHLFYASWLSSHNDARTLNAWAKANKGSQLPLNWGVQPALTVSQILQLEDDIEGNAVDEEDEIIEDVEEEER